MDCCFQGCRRLSPATVQLLEMCFVLVSYLPCSAGSIIGSIATLCLPSLSQRLCLCAFDLRPLMKSQLPVKSRASFLIAGEEEAAKEGVEGRFTCGGRTQTDSLALEKVTKHHIGGRSSDSGRFSNDAKAKLNRGPLLRKPKMNCSCTFCTEAEKVVFVPTKVESLTGVAIKMVALGSEHSLAVTDKGEALSWGGGESGRLGHGHEPSMLGFLRSASEFTPRLIKKLEGFKIKSIAAGMLHSACIDENGSVFVFGERQWINWRWRTIHMGSNENGCLGTGYLLITTSQKVQMDNLFLLVHFLLSAVQMSVFSRKSSRSILETCCLPGSERLYPVAGSIQQLSLICLGSGDKLVIIADMQKDRFMHGAGEVLMERFLRRHSPGGQLGQGNDVDYITPTRVIFGRNVKALQVSCGFNHTGAILESI
ncbi:hypothetical protein C3L33_18370, partial [Rhododendron williamsianum]